MKSMEGLVQCSVNYVPLTPISFLERAAIVYRDRTSIVYGSAVKFTWKETRERCVRLASSLSQYGISRGDVVAVLAPNVPAMIELHFGVPMAGAVLCPLNIRHDAAMLSFLLNHSEAKVIFVDYQFLELAVSAVDLLSSKSNSNPPLLVLISDSDQSSPPSTKMGSGSESYLEYESLIATGKQDFEIIRPNDELEPISLSYTSGTTSSPKGVVFHHRGAYLNALGTVSIGRIAPTPVYLWTVPMFHVNGWCLIWGMAAQGGTNICLRNVTAKGIFDNIALYKVTNLGGAPTVLNMIANAPPTVQKPLPFVVGLMTGGAPPPPQVLLRMEEMGFRITHVYGLTETFGPTTTCEWKPEWDSLPPYERAKFMSRQGLHHVIAEGVDIIDPVTMKSVPADSKTMGEVMLRGNNVMSGYLKNLEATKEAFGGGWFRSGDLAVKHPDGNIEVKDRSKDIIISGGENISTIEVESILFTHPAILEAAVVGRPDDHWGETPCAFVKLKEGKIVTADEIIKYCRDRLSHYMAPRTVVFQDLPKTSTGKIMKFELKEKAKAMGSLTQNSKL